VLKILRNILKPRANIGRARAGGRCAKTLFGETRGRALGVGSIPANFDADPRLLALFDAYKT